jgi:hypothetical protein
VGITSGETSCLAGAVDRGDNLGTVGLSACVLGIAVAGVALIVVRISGRDTLVVCATAERTLVLEKAYFGLTAVYPAVELIGFIPVIGFIV